MAIAVPGFTHTTATVTDVKGAPDPAREHINGWVAAHTHDKITNRGDPLHGPLHRPAAVTAAGA